MKTIVLLTLLAAGGAVIWWLLEQLGGSDGAGKEQSVTTELPPQLAGAKIWGKEVPVSCREPRRIHGKLDEGFQLPSGEVVLSETKSRQRAMVHKSDVIQLSAYAVAVSEGGRHKVAAHGFIRALTPQGNKYIQVTLMPPQEVAAVHDKYRHLVSGKDKGSKCGRAQLCRSCLYKDECDAMD